MYLDGGEEKICVCPSNHKTGQGNPYWHAHLNHSFPMIGLIDGVWKTVTASMKEAYWDCYYDGYTKVGTYSVSQNCYGYALGTGTFLKDGAYGSEIIINDDWQETGLESGATVAYKVGHAIKVTPKHCTDDVSGWYIIQKSSEKNCASAVYEKSGDCPSGVGLKGGSYKLYKPK